MVKNLLSLAAAAVLFSGVANAQQPVNAGFENWSAAGKPDNYSGYGDIGLSIGAPTYAFLTTCFKETTSKQSGSASIRLETKQFAALQNRVLPGFAQVGTFDAAAFEINGIPYSGRPGTLSGYYRYSPVNGSGVPTDSAGIAAYFYKYDATAGESNIIGAAEFLITSATSGTNFVSFSVPIQWGSFEDPDSMTIILVSTLTQDSAAQVGHIGTKFWVDDLSFADFTTGAKESISAQVATKVAPNPATNVLNLTTSDKNIGGSIRFFDVTGKEVKSAPVSAVYNNISIADLNNGIYLYQVLDASKKVTSTGKFSVVK